MRRTTPAVLAALLILGSTPVLATDAEPSADAVAGFVRVEAPGVGLSMEFPADWRVSQPTGTRLSAITTADDEPVMETTAILAQGADAWCDVDVYLALDAPLLEHGYLYADHLAQSAGADSAMIVDEAELPAGPAVRIEILDPERGRLRAFSLFDGPAAEDGTANRFLLTCAAPIDTQPFWDAIAESAVVFEPVVPDEEPAAESPAAESPAADA